MNTITVGPVPPLAMPMNAARNNTPVAMLNTPHPRLPRRMNRTPKMTVATVKAMNPIPPDARCTRPYQLKAPGPAGVPGGNPSAGSAMKNPAPTWPAPKMPSSTGTARSLSARPMPVAAAMTIRPLRTSTPEWIQPNGPSSIRLQLCRLKSKPVTQQLSKQTNSCVWWFHSNYRGGGHRGIYQDRHGGDCRQRDRRGGCRPERLYRGDLYEVAGCVRGAATRLLP